MAWNEQNHEKCIDILTFTKRIDSLGLDGAYLNSA